MKVRSTSENQWASVGELLLISYTRSFYIKQNTNLLIYIERYIKWVMKCYLLVNVLVIH